MIYVNLEKTTEKARKITHEIADACAYARLRGRNFKPFVSIRVREIQSNSDPITWRYLPGEYNVTDDVSRGISAQSDRKMPTRSTIPFITRRA